MIKAIQLLDEFCEKSDYMIVELRGEKIDGIVKIAVLFKKTDGDATFNVRREFSKPVIENDHLLELELHDMEAELVHYMEEMGYES